MVKMWSTDLYFIIISGVNHILHLDGNLIWTWLFDSDSTSLNVFMEKLWGVYYENFFGESWNSLASLNCLILCTIFCQYIFNNMLELFDQQESIEGYFIKSAKAAFA